MQFRLILFPLLLLADVATTLAQEPTKDMSLDSYRCNQFLADAAHPDDAATLLRSMMTISWAAGFAASHEKQGIRFDNNALELVAAALGDICRNHSTELATNAFAIAVEAVAAQGGPIGPVTWPLDFTLDNQTGSKITEISSRHRADRWQSMNVTLANGYHQDVKFGAVGHDQTSCSYDILVKISPNLAGFLDGVNLCQIKRIVTYLEAGEIKFKTEKQE